MIIHINSLLLIVQLVKTTFIFPGVEVPHAVIIMKGNKFQCQGINWDGDVVLTPAHCVEPNVKYNILAGFTDQNGMMKRYLYRTTSIYVYQFEKFNQHTMDHDMALLLLKDLIRASYVTGPANPHNCIVKNLKECFLILWDMSNPGLLAYPVSVKLRPGMCQTSSIFPGITVFGRVFCGEADLCIPDVSGATLNCAKETVGMVVKTKCIDSDSKTEFLFINLDNAREEINTYYRKIVFNMTNSTHNARPNQSNTYKRRRFDNSTFKSSVAEKKFKSGCAGRDYISISLFIIGFLYIMSFYNK